MDLLINDHQFLYCVYNELFEKILQLLQNNYFYLNKRKGNSNQALTKFLSQIDQIEHLLLSEF
jgi:hypothetical protein